MTWEDWYAPALTDLGFMRGIASPCCLFNVERSISLVVHGDDFAALFARNALKSLLERPANVFQVKLKGRLGKPRVTIRRRESELAV